MSLFPFWAKFSPRMCKNFGQITAVHYVCLCHCKYIFLINLPFYGFPEYPCWTFWWALYANFDHLALEFKLKVVLNDTYNAKSTAQFITTAYNIRIQKPTIFPSCILYLLSVYNSFIILQLCYAVGRQWGGVDRNICVSSVLLSIRLIIPIFQNLSYSNI